MITLAPKLRICSLTLDLAPEPIAAMLVIAATPMTMPSMVRQLRTGAATKEEAAMRV